MLLCATIAIFAAAAAPAQVEELENLEVAECESEIVSDADNLADSQAIVLLDEEESEAVSEEN